MATKTTPEKVLDAIGKAERSQNWTATKAGFSPSTLRRKLKGESDFTIGEVSRIAAALSVPPHTLLPSEFKEVR